MGCMTFLFRNVLSRSLCNVRIVSIRKGGLLWFCLGYLCKWMSLCLRLCFFSCQFYWAFLGFTLYYSWNPFVKVSSHLVIEFFCLKLKLGVIEWITHVYLDLVHVTKAFPNEYHVICWCYTISLFGLKLSYRFITCITGNLPVFSVIYLMILK